MFTRQIKLAVVSSQITPITFVGKTARNNAKGISKQTNTAENMTRYR